MRKTLLKVGLASAALLLMSSAASAQTVNQPLAVSVTIGSRAQLTLSTANLVIPDRDPATFTTLVAPALTVTVGARTASAQPINLTVVATGGDLTGTGGTIPIANLTWASTGTGFDALGTSNAATAQSVGQWTGSGLRTGAQTYSLPNDWLYAPGTYATSLTYTLVVP
jgi:hypothetical protein